MAQAKLAAEIEREDAQARCSQARELIRGIGEIRHPYDLGSGQAQMPLRSNRCVYIPPYSVLGTDPSTRPLYPPVLGTDPFTPADPFTPDP